jgi:hypothetical protein
MNDCESIPWDDVANGAYEAFHVWMGGGDKAFAEEVWRSWRENGDVGRRNLVEETQSCLKLLTLARMYWGFCRCAWDENAERSLIEVADQMPIWPIALGVLAGRHGFDADDELTEEELQSPVLCDLTERFREQVFESLAVMYGGADGIYSRMWKTNGGSPEDDAEWDVNGWTGSAYAYVCDGCVF